MQDEIQIDNISTSSDCHSIDGRQDISPQDAAAAEGSDRLKKAKCADGEACEGSEVELKATKTHTQIFKVNRREFYCVVELPLSDYPLYGKQLVARG